MKRKETSKRSSIPGWFAKARKQFALDIAKKKELKEQIKHGIWRLTWNAKDGSVKVMDITLDPAVMPLMENSKPRVKQKNQTPKGAVVLKAWSTDRKGWRSFNVCSLISISQL